MKLIKELAAWLMLLYPSVALFSTTTDYYQLTPSNKIAAVIFDPYLILTGWRGGGLPWIVATFVGLFLILFTWYLLVRLLFINRPHKAAKIVLTLVMFLSAWSFTGNFAVIKNGYSPVYFNPIRPIRTDYGCMSRKQVFWFIYEQYSWC